jgi:hypothetical protein
MSGSRRESNFGLRPVADCGSKGSEAEIFEIARWAARHE